MSKWKIQAIEPDTCEPPGCRYLELWDVETDPLTRTHTIVAFDRVCAAHSTPEIEAHIAADEMLWADGNWKPKASYLEYQRAWFRRLNHVEWLRDHPREQMPETIRGLTADPVTTGSKSVPPQARLDALARVGGWNRRDNLRKNLAIDAMAQERGQGFDRNTVTGAWAGAGEARVLHVTAGQLTAQQRGRVQSALAIQFGPNAVVLDG